MTKFAPTPEGKAAAERMMQTHGHTYIGMAPKPGFPGAAASAAPVKPRVKPTVTGAPATPITPKPMGGLNQAMSNLGIKKGTGPMIGQRFGGMKKGGAVKKAVSAKTSAKTMASRRGDGCAVRGKTKAGIK